MGIVLLSDGVSGHVSELQMNSTLSDLINGTCLVSKHSALWLSGKTYPLDLTFNPSENCGLINTCTDGLKNLQAQVEDKGVALKTLQQKLAKVRNENIILATDSMLASGLISIGTFTMQKHLYIYGGNLVYIVAPLMDGVILFKANELDVSMNAVTFGYMSGKVLGFTIFY